MKASKFLLTLSTLSFVCVVLGAENDSKKSFRKDLEKAPLSSPSLLERKAIEFSAGTDNETIAAEVSKSFGKDIWSLKLSAPIDRVNKNGTLPNLDGLSNAISASVIYKRVMGEPTRLDNPYVGYSKVDELCIEAAKLNKLDNPETYIDENCDDTDELGLFLLNEEEAEKLGENANSVRQQLQQIQNQYDCILWAGVESGDCKKNFGIFSFGASVGTEEFDFFNASTFEKSSTDETQFSLEASYTLIRIPSKWVYRLGYRYEDIYKSAADQIFCDTSSNSNPVICQSGAVGEPNNTTRNIVNFEVRRIFDNVGIAPKISYDFEESVTGIELPIFLTRNNTGQLSGGISVGWTDADDDSDVVVSLFFGREFKFLE